MQSSFCLWLSGSTESLTGRKYRVVVMLAGYVFNFSGGENSLAHFGELEKLHCIKQPSPLPQSILAGCEVLICLELCSFLRSLASWSSSILALEIGSRVIAFWPHPAVFGETCYPRAVKQWLRWLPSFCFKQNALEVEDAGDSPIYVPWLVQDSCTAGVVATLCLKVVSDRPFGSAFPTTWMKKLL